MKWIVVVLNTSYSDALEEVAWSFSGEIPDESRHRFENPDLIYAHGFMFKIKDKMDLFLHYTELEFPEVKFDIIKVYDKTGEGHAS